MKVKELIELLKKQDPEKPVMIQQGEEFDYMDVYSVKEQDVVHEDSDDDSPLVAVVIEYQ